MTTTLYKIANQPVRFRFNSGYPVPLCSKCRTIISRPLISTIYDTDFNSHKHTKKYYIFHYVGTPYFIIESKSGFAATYCSEYCMKKHNAIFRVKK
jgi:hypothetical protein